MTPTTLQALAAFLEKRGVKACYVDDRFAPAVDFGDDDSYESGEHPQLAFLLMDLLEKEGWQCDLYSRPPGAFRRPEERYMADVSRNGSSHIRVFGPTRTEALVEAAIAVGEKGEAAHG